MKVHVTEVKKHKHKVVPKFKHSLIENVVGARLYANGVRAIDNIVKCRRRKSKFLQTVVSLLKKYSICFWIFFFFLQNRNYSYTARKCIEFAPTTGEIKVFSCVRLLRHTDKNGNLGWKAGPKCSQQHGTIPCQHVIAAYLLYCPTWPPKKKMLKNPFSHKNLIELLKQVAEKEEK